MAVGARWRRRRRRGRFAGNRLVCDEGAVRRVDTPRLCAGADHAMRPRDLTMRQFPRDAVRQPLATVDHEVICLLRGQPGSSPEPATVRIFDSVVSQTRCQCRAKWRSHRRPPKPSLRVTASRAPGWPIPSASSCPPSMPLPVDPDTSRWIPIHPRSSVPCVGIVCLQSSILVAPRLQSVMEHARLTDVPRERHRRRGQWRSPLTVVCADERQSSPMPYQCHPAVGSAYRAREACAQLSQPRLILLPSHPLTLSSCRVGVDIVEKDVWPPKSVGGHIVPRRARCHSSACAAAFALGAHGNQGI
jgi:hypothetical protein